MANEVATNNIITTYQVGAEIQSMQNSQEKTIATLFDYNDNGIVDANELKARNKYNVTGNGTKLNFTNTNKDVKVSFTCNDFKDMKDYRLNDNGLEMSKTFAKKEKARLGKQKNNRGNLNRRGIYIEWGAKGSGDIDIDLTQGTSLTVNSFKGKKVAFSGKKNSVVNLANVIADKVFVIGAKTVNLMPKAVTEFVHNTFQEKGRSVDAKELYVDYVENLTMEDVKAKKLVTCHTQNITMRKCVIEKEFLPGTESGRGISLTLENTNLKTVKAFGLTNIDMKESVIGTLKNVHRDSCKISTDENSEIRSANNKKLSNYDGLPVTYTEYKNKHIPPNTQKKEKVEQ